ncbi:MAG TPA: glycosyltransferase family 4 protein [Tepidisphaeraceae bacterium]|nr:glycosyltransferase family 4 protein [Tepidisphaeraceae bacterium]
MRILQFTDADVWAGTERLILELATGLRTAGVECVIASPPASPLAVAAREKGLGTLDIPRRRFINRGAIVAIARLLRSGEIDILHCHNGRTALHAAVARRIAGRGQLIMTQHFLQPARCSRRGIARIASSLVHAWMSRQFDRVIAISDAVAQSMLERADLPADRMVTVHNGISPPDPRTLANATEVRAGLAVADSSPMIFTAARLEREKDIATLITAMSQVVQAVPAVRCFIAGDGRLRKELQAQIELLRLQQSVSLLGHRNDALSLLNAADVFVLPSPAEPFGLAILEAMALAKPVIATRAGGPLEIVEDNRTGLLVPPSNPTALADAIIALLGDIERAHSMGIAGRQRFESRFTAEKMARAVADVYAACQPGLAVAPQRHMFSSP